MNLNKTWEDAKNVYFNFLDKNYIVSIDKKSSKIKCNCFNGSNMGINNKQLCKHKRYILDKAKVYKGVSL